MSKRPNRLRLRKETMIKRGCRERMATHHVTKRGQRCRSGTKGTSQTGSSHILDPNQHYEEDPYYQTAQEHYVQPDEHYDQLQQFEEPHHEEEVKPKQHGAPKAPPAPYSSPGSSSNLSLLSSFDTHVQGRPCASASRPLAHGLKLRGPSKFG